MPVLGLQMKAAAPTPPVTLTPRLRAMGPTPITPGIPPELPSGSTAQREGEPEGGRTELDRAQAMERVMGGIGSFVSTALSVGWCVRLLQPTSRPVLSAISLFGRACIGIHWSVAFSQKK